MVLTRQFNHRSCRSKASKDIPKIGADGNNSSSEPFSTEAIELSSIEGSIVTSTLSWCKSKADERARENPKKGTKLSEGLEHCLSDSGVGMLPKELVRLRGKTGGGTRS
jgi:hypothetical protein